MTTADAGSTWSFVASLPPAVVGDAAAISKLRFANSHDGWAFGPQLWSTHDGGHSWRQIAESGSVADVEASGGQAYAVVGTRLLHTPVTTDSWTPVVGATLGSGARSIALHAHAAWIVAGSGPGTSKLVMSADGVSWRTVADPCASLGGEWALSGVAPVSTTAVYLLCAGDAGAGSQSKKVMFSSDGGLNAKPTATDPPRGGDVGDIAAASAAVVAVSARSGASWVYRSADSGHDWQAPLQQGDGGVGYFDLGFTTSTQGVAIYGQPRNGPASKLLMTHNAGASWAVVTF